MRTLSTPAAPTASPPAEPGFAAPAATTASTAPVVEPKPQPAATPVPTLAPMATTTAAATVTAAANADASSSAPSSPVEVTCREERLEITTEWHTLGTAKLRKYVTTEQVERRIPVVRERVRVERTPISDAERATLTEKEISEAVEEVTLREERAVVRKYLAPVERVRLIVERYTTEEVVREELRRENVEVHDATATRPTASATPAPSSAPPSSASPDVARDMAHEAPRPAGLRPLV